MAVESNGWESWAKHVLIELERLNRNIETIQGDLHEMNVQLEILKVKHALLGVIGGCLPTMVYIIYKHFN